ncbi:MAG TPA: bifunctional alpha,alpha-trehalose-phosphate synthase (UDP-forming)/trehalose-phosphatase [Candidatus Saccharibacteria bacterium]|nr:bifunctional alpha,alpha-trehalose-phosphate synthase (UDP-forming)/trehalose-phosphatase [Candidatus Saccharibacteria bacterium]HRK94252.1 bifunctional alpha,alpha-trehalose-phosphate synthase (UDP-forming)/trehalose-phosphatase [Candidatus Saccharibacteria bacterium]
MPRYNLVIVSNRLPINVSRKNGKLIFEESAGGLARAMSSLEQQDRIWVGWPGIAADDLTEEEKVEVETELAAFGCYPVHLASEQVEQFYEGYSNDTLWPLFHYFQSLSHHRDEYWAAYQEVNRLFADAVESCSEQSGSIWVHDYHLMMLPGILRERLARATIGFFLHIPFPSFEIYRLLPQRKELLRGLLGADLIGFHIYDYARHFLSSCLRLLGLSSYQGLLEYDGRTVKTDAYPIGIDYDKFRNALSEGSVKKSISALNESHKGQKLIISVDRLDYSKGIPERLEAFRILLADYPQFREKVRLVMVAVPSRTEVETYQNLRDQIEQTVSRINGEYGTVDWAPISYQFQNLPFEEVVALYAAADVALVTPIRDGMNLVAKEYVASKQNKPGVLILSEMTGAIDELPEALSINPSDAKSVAEAMHHALRMSKREQLRRLSVMQRRLKSYTVQAWANDFLQDLEAAGGKREQQHKKRMTASERQALVDAYRSASSRLIILDYDGTLKDFVPSPRALMAQPSLKLRRMLKRLATNDANQLAIVSGRPRKALERWFRGIDVTLIAEHGAWTRYDGKWTHTDNDFKHVKKQLKPILAKYVSRTAGSEIEEKDYSLVWHYRNVVPELAYVRAAEIKRELVEVISSDEIGVFSGDKVIEIKPNDINKGYAASELEAVYQSEFILCAGDDYTDEDMFRDLPAEAYTIKVGPGDTRAHAQLASVTEMTTLLEELSYLE